MEASGWVAEGAELDNLVKKMGLVMAPKWEVYVWESLDEGEVGMS